MDYQDGLTCDFLEEFRDLSSQQKLVMLMLV